SVDTTKILSGAIDTTKLLNGVVTTAILAPNSVDTTKILSGAIDTTKFLNGVVTTAILAPTSVDTTKIAADAVTKVKILANSIDTTRLIGDAGSTFNLLQSSGVASGPVWVRAPFSIDHTIGAVGATNTAAETTLYTYTSLSAGSFGTTDGMEIIVWGTVLYNNAVANSLTMRVRETSAAGTIMCQTGAMVPAALSATVRGFVMRVEIRNFNSTTAQDCKLEWALSTPISPPIANDTIGLTSYTSQAGGKTIDGKAMFVTAQWSAASANNSIIRRVAHARFLP
ncbi:MAG: hypothetical protein ACHQ2Z_15510, partial [Elusimicrobiota bacterium]